MRSLLIISFCLVCITASAQFKNIKLAEEAEGFVPPLDPSITINHKKPGNIVAGIGLNRSVYSLDSGRTWIESILTSPFGVFGNPSVISDAKGDIYFFHRADPGGLGPGNDAWLDRIVCQKSDDGGKFWNKGVSIGNNPPKDQDRQWPAVHPKKQIIYTTWTQYDTYGSDDKNCQSHVLFSISTNAGNKWDKPVQISQTPGDCANNDNTAIGAVPAVALDGRIYVTWANQGFIFFDRSYDGGKTWLTNDLGIAKQSGGWSMTIPGINHCNGMPVLMVDNSPSRAHGSLYLVYADQKNGENDTDIWFTRTTSRGDYWTPPVRINSDEQGRHQFLPWMAVDQTNGNVYIVYYDRRAYDDLQTDVYLAYSTDGGNTFVEKKISESPFVPEDSKPFSTYINIAAHAGIITPIWTRMDNGKTSVWTTVIKQEELLKK